MENKQLECSVCLENIPGNELKYTECMHAFHEKCIDKWSGEKKNCPVCRYSINAQITSNNTSCNSTTVLNSPRIAIHSDSLSFRWAPSNIGSPPSRIYYIKEKRRRRRSKEKRRRRRSKEKRRRRRSKEKRRRRRSK